MKKLILFVLILAVLGCKKSNDAPAPTTQQKYVLMRVEYSNGATAVIDSVMMGDPVTHKTITIAGKYITSRNDSVLSPNGNQVMLNASGGNGSDIVELIDQDNYKNKINVGTGINLISLSNFHAIDSFVIKVYRP